ncbi:MAG: selenocysteine-specific translation elongation factor [Caldilineae bacterium]|nr:MAG: selenocysteine-specific translation elongation factor [Caldilineae bacterium]
MRVIATAGHVDHGKSALVRALTGIDPDRLAEEKARGLTIDLGFAWMELSLPGASDPEQIGIVDVPGHIDFIKNMLAGVGSVDAALLVIAADEGVMPQTREHLAILDLLAVPTGVVALTKIDLIDDPEWLELVELDVQELLADTRLAHAPIAPVSAHTGAGLDALRQTLAQALVELPPRRDRARPRLPIDRVFTLPGFGVIVTGTLSDGHFALGDPVEILPDGPTGRIRGLQSHKQALEQAQPGSRVAINLSGVSADQIHRGQVVVKPGSLRATRLIDASFRLLPDAPKPLVHNQRVDFFSGAAETPGYVRLLGVEELPPGATGWVQVRLDRPVLVAAGDRYILRQPSPSATLGGGEILDPHPRRRYRRFDPTVLQRLETLARGAPDEILLQTLERSPLLTREELVGQSGLGVEPAEAALDELLASAAVRTLDGGRLLVAASTVTALLEELRRLLAAHHRTYPLRQGMPRGEVRNRLRVPQARGPAGELPLRAFNDLVELAAAEGLVRADDNFVWLAEHQVTFTPPQQAAVDRTLAAFARNPYAPPNAQETLRLLGGDQALLDALVEQGTLVRLPGNVYLRGEDFAHMVEQVQAFITAHGSITLAQARDLFDTSRKYAQALLEEMDARRITRRVGDERILRLGG